MWRESGGRTGAGKVAGVGALVAGTGCEGEERDGEDVGELHFVGDVRVILGGKWTSIQVVRSSFKTCLFNWQKADDGRYLYVYICI